MTDQETLRPKYKAGYNLHPEIGNILLEVDTDAKTVTPSLEPDSPYTLTGGGGGVTYVIPEQTVTFPSSGTKVQLSDIGSLNELNNGEQVIIRMTRDGAPENEALYVPATYHDGTIEGSIGGGGSTILVTKDGSNWKISYDVGMPVFPLTATISAIKGF